MFTYTGCRKRSTRNPDAFTTIRLRRLLEASALLSDEAETPTVVHDFTEPDMNSFPFDFEEIALVTGTTTLTSGVAEIHFDDDGDWSIVGIALKSATMDRRPIPIDRAGMLYQHFAAAIEQGCRDEIDEAVGHVMAERRGQGRRMLAAE